MRLRGYSNEGLQEGAQDLGPYSHILKGSGQGMKKNGSPRPGNRSAGSATMANSRAPSKLNSKSSIPSEKGNGSSLYAPMLSKGDIEADDLLHDMNDRGDRFNFCSFRGILNVTALFLLVAGLLALFAGYPIISHFTARRESNKGAFNIGGTNGTGQVPLIVPQLKVIDPDTPSSAQRWTNTQGQPYHLVFSDEFEEEGRTFWPQDDPFWEAVDIWYGATGDYEWYHPGQINTTGGALQITMEDKPMHDLNFRSGMLQSWNKFCFQGGYIEFSATLPGSPEQVGWWPGLWLEGNLARPGYLGTTDGMWPYSYQACDSGILKNQTAPGRQGHDAVSTYEQKYDSRVGLNWLSGMRYPSCTCGGEDHPGPSNDVARAAPELDILEAQIYQKRQGEASQSLQIAPFDMDYDWDQSLAQIFDDDVTKFNAYTGGVYQEAVSGLTEIPAKSYALTGNEYVRYGVDYTPDWNGDGKGRVTWYLDDKPTWTVTSDAFPARPAIDVSQRIVPVEPMAIIMNLGISRGFQADLDFDTLTFPAIMKVDYVRVYQPDSYKEDLISCDPPDHPTKDFIERHREVYNNPNYTTWPKDFPKNRITGC